jgi:hypothetical protein
MTRKQETRFISAKRQQMPVNGKTSISDMNRDEQNVSSEGETLMVKSVDHNNDANHELIVFSQVH